MAGGGGNEPNLTPFIDLFSVLVCFLLMTAAWLQLESLQVTIEKAPTPGATAQNPEPTPPPKDEKKKVSLSVFLYKEKIVTKENETEKVIPRSGQDPFDDMSLIGVLKEWRTKFPEKRDIVLNTEATVTYGSMIKLYDVLVANDWPDVGINPN